MIKIFLVEDDFFHLHDIKITIEELGHEFLGSSSDSLEILDKVEKLQPHVILMDIHLNGKQEGIALAKRIQTSFGTKIIFTSSDISSQTMSEAVETKPVAYLTKPINKNDLQAALLLAKSILKENNVSLEPTNNKEIYIKHNNKLIKVIKTEILYAFADTKNYCTLVTEDNKKLTLRTSITSLLKSLNDTSFIQTHRAYFINCNKIDSLSEQNQEIIIKGFSIPLGKTFKNQLYQRLNIL